MLLVDGVTVRYGDTVVLDGYHLTVDAGEIVALVGASGSGKSTLLRAIAGIVDVDAGTIWLDHADITHLATHRRDVAMVFQDNQLFPHLSVADNVGFGLRMRHVDVDNRASAVTQLLDRVGLTGFEDRSISDLSGGEAKRVALARSLAPSPRLLLLDEPLTGLDADLHDRLMVDVADLLRTERITAIWVTHDRIEAKAVSSRIVDLTSAPPR